MLLQELAINAIWNDFSRGTELFVVFTIELGETPLARDDNQLTAGEFELGTTEGFESIFLVLNSRSRHEHN